LLDSLDYEGVNDGTVTGAVLNYSDGKVGAGYTFDGDDDYIVLSNSNKLSPDTGNFSISMWFKTSQTGGSNYLYRDIGGDSTPQLYIRTRIADGGIENFFRDIEGDKVFVQYTTPVNDGVWHHVVSVRNGISTSLYIDGVAVGSNSNPALGNISVGDAKRPTIGIRAEDLLVNDFNGSIDEVMIYNRSLSATEVKQLYYGGLLGGHTLNSSLTTFGDNWTFGARAGDSGNTFGDEVNSSSIEILNSVPSITSVTMNATSVLNISGDNLTGFVTANDADGDNITFDYNWYKTNSTDTNVTIATTLLEDPSLVACH